MESKENKVCNKIELAQKCLNCSALGNLCNGKKASERALTLSEASLVIANYGK